jgi:hypothetical protein
LFHSDQHQPAHHFHTREPVLSRRREPFRAQLGLFQVDSLNVQISELNEQVKEVPLLRSSLEKALKEANDADSKLQVAVNENEQIQEQVCLDHALTIAHWTLALAVHPFLASSVSLLLITQAPE